MNRSGSRAAARCCMIRRMNSMAREGHRLSLVAALDRRRVIGRKGDLPWRLPNDLKHFKRLTEGRIVLMGRNTWDSLGRPLPNRDNWVITRDASLAPDGARVFASIEAALCAAAGAELMVIGGAQIYEQTLPLAQRLYLTYVDAEVDGDVFFPRIDPGQWRELARESHPADERHAYPYAFATLVRT